MKNILERISIMLFVMAIIFSGIVNVEAKDNIKDQENIEQKAITTRSGGFVKSVHSVQSCTLDNTKMQYTDLVDDWAETSSYTVTKTVTTTSTTTLSIALDTTIREALKAKFGITYGVSVSTSGSIGRVIQADASRDSKLRHEVQVKTYNIVVRFVDTYYDTSLGYYDRIYTYSGKISIPNKDETYIRVYYKS